MTSLEAHRENAKELIEDVEEKLRTGTIVRRQKVVGFACSEASCDMLAILLHKKNLIDPGFIVKQVNNLDMITCFTYSKQGSNILFISLYCYNVNHRFFSSIKIANSRFDFEFPSKEKLLPLFVKQEDYRNMLCYGKPKEDKSVEECIENLFLIKKIIEEEIGENI